MFLCIWDSIQLFISHWVVRLFGSPHDLTFQIYQTSYYSLKVMFNVFESIFESTYDTVWYGIGNFQGKFDVTMMIKYMFKSKSEWYQRKSRDHKCPWDWNWWSLKWNTKSSKTNSTIHCLPKMQFKFWKGKYYPCFICYRTYHMAHMLYGPYNMTKPY